MADEKKKIDMRCVLQFKSVIWLHDFIICGVVQLWC